MKLMDTKKITVQEAFEQQMKLRKELDEVMTKYINTMDAGTMIGELFNAASKFSGFVSNCCFKEGFGKWEKDQSEGGFAE